MITVEQLAQHLHTDAGRWPDRHGNYHADCPYCQKEAKKGQTHFRIASNGLCYCQVCQHGTTISALAQHLGIADTKNGSRPSTEYSYYTAAGELVYQVVRYYKPDGTKTFFQRRPDANGGWINDLKGVERVLYRLPGLLASIAGGQRVYIVEGEKDADILSMRGLCATTNVGGAGKWGPGYSEALRGADVIILPDNDSPGQAHAAQIRQSLHDIAASVKIVRLPGLLDKGDISDWFALGHTVDELDALISAPALDLIPSTTKPRTISAAELRRKNFPNLVWTVDGLIPEGLCMLAGKPKSKKSWLALGVAVSVCCGGKAFNYYDVTKGRVLYLDLESNQRRMKSRLQGIISEREAWPENFDIATEWPRGHEGIALLDGYCEAHPDTRLIVIDIWARFRPSRDPKADAYEQDYNALQELNAWAESRNVTVIVIHHTRKAKSEDVFEEISGTTGIVGAVATALILTRSPDMPDEQLLHMTGRDLIVDEPIALKWDNYTCQHLYVATGAEASSSAERRKILAVMEDDKDYHLKELAKLSGKTVQNLANQLRRLMDDVLIQRTGRGTYSKVIISSEVGEVGEVSVIGVKSEQGKDSLTHYTAIHGSVIESVNDSPLPEQANGLLHELHDDSTPTQNRDLFSDGVPSGLNAGQWERARYAWGLGRFKEFADVARESGMDYAKLKLLVEGAAT